MGVPLQRRLAKHKVVRGIGGLSRRGPAHDLRSFGRYQWAANDERAKGIDEVDAAGMGYVCGGSVGWVEEGAPVAKVGRQRGNECGD